MDRENLDKLVEKLAPGQKEAVVKFVEAVGLSEELMEDVAEVTKAHIKKTFESCKMLHPDSRAVVPIVVAELMDNTISLMVSAMGKEDTKLLILKRLEQFTDEDGVVDK